MAGLCEGGNEPPGSLKASLAANDIQEDMLPVYGACHVKLSTIGCRSSLNFEYLVGRSVEIVTEENVRQVGDMISADRMERTIC
ncbi:hypothetical protein ANN_11899 [Periplaneta americana]|uniref:Uncharacterized protein n=1 Tax=Periplaneta americana TaxID=6978 RepID=A0ABQ8T8K9_PERAM|nr:hypothetical protein ANN_11899 [Periplaneta americana]